jgi:hypothetical protein
LFSRAFNHVACAAESASDSGADFLALAPLVNVYSSMWAANSSGSLAMTMANRLSVVAAYVAFAFVGAIVLGVF